MSFWNGTRWVEDGPATIAPRSHNGRRFLGATAEAALITLLTFGLITGVALAARGGNGGKPNSGATLSPVVLDGTDTVPNHTERVTFEVATTATDRPFVSLSCWQGSTGVYGKTIGIFPTYLFDPWFTLDSSYWTPGVEASCTARAFYVDKRGNQHDLTSMVVVVAP